MNLLQTVKHALGGSVKMSDEYPKDLRANDVYGMQREISQQLLKLESIMSALTDLQAAVTAAVNEIASLKSQLSAVPPTSSVSDAEAETLATTLNTAVNPPAAAPEAAVPAA
jgi:hypothetical protein